MVADGLMLVVVVALLWLCRLFWRLYAEWERARYVALLVAACEQTYDEDPAEPGLKFSWVMRRLQKRYPRAEYERLGEEIKAAMWAVRGK